MAPTGFADLLRYPVVVAPMAGGPSTADLVIAAARAGALGFLAAGYKTPAAMAAEIATALTRAFSGRPARALVNQFIRDHADAPAAYPEINNATRPLRAAAAARGDPERMSLFAGQGFRSAAERPAGEIIERLCPEP
jgi:nitronate monooxygenase